MKGIAITDEMRDEIVAMARVGGFTVADIAQEIGTSPSTVQRVLAAVDAKRLVPEEKGEDDTYGSKLDAATFMGIAKAYADGMITQEICRTFNITPSTLYGVLRETGMQTRAQQQAQERNRRLQDAVKMYEQGSPIWEIVAATEVSTFTLNQELHRRGVPLRRPRKLVS